ncbi:hypothetical protein KCU62_g371, partial [Aureobasidium sp. EXF-3399]
MKVVYCERRPEIDESNQSDRSSRSGTTRAVCCIDRTCLSITAWKKEWSRHAAELALAMTQPLVDQNLGGSRALSSVRS